MLAHLFLGEACGQGGAPPQRFEQVHEEQELPVAQPPVAVQVTAPQVQANWLLSRAIIIIIINNINDINTDDNKDSDNINE